MRQCEGQKRTGEERYKHETSNSLFYFFLLFIFLFFVPLSSALTSINIFIDESGTAAFLGQSDQSSLILPEGIKLDDGEITGITHSITSKDGNNWNIFFSSSETEFTVILPENAVISTIKSGEISIDESRISIFVQNEIDISYFIDEKNIEDKGINILLLIIFIAIFIVLVIFVINFSNRERKKNKAKKPTIRKKRRSTLEIIKKVLNEREKEIVDKLKETGKIKGSQLRKILEIPKASFSRHVQELEKKGIIKRTGEGRNKFIQLIKR